MSTDTGQDLALLQQISDLYAANETAREQALTEARNRVETRFDGKMHGRVRRVMNALGKRHGLAPLAWAHMHLDRKGYASLDAPEHLVTAMVLDPGAHRSEDEQNRADVALAERWATTLGLAPYDRQRHMPGALGWRGTVGGIEVDLWAISDRDAWEAGNQARYGGGRS